MAELQALFPKRTNRFYRHTLKEAARLRIFNEFEVLRYPMLNSSNIHHVCEILGKEHLDLALKKGRGAILMIGHFGANQMIMPALGYRGYSINQLSAPPTVWADILPERSNALWRQKLELRWQLEQTLPVNHQCIRFFDLPLIVLKPMRLAFDGGWNGMAQIPFMGRK